MLKIVAGLAALSIAVPAVPQAEPPATITAHPSVVQVSCDEGMGTAFRVAGPEGSAHGLISVNHVTSMHGCVIVGDEPVHLRMADVARDVSFGRLDSEGPGLRIDCSGFHDGELLFAYGYALGRPYQRMIAVRVSAEATKEVPWRGFTALVGAETFIPGMSGGPVINRKGEVVGTVNGYMSDSPISYSRPLSETAACTGRL